MYRLNAYDEYCEFLPNVFNAFVYFLFWLNYVHACMSDDEFRSVHRFYFASKLVKFDYDDDDDDNLW